MNILGLVLPALLPAVADGMKGLFQKFFGGSKPVSVDEQIKLMSAETEKLRAIAELDMPSDNISLWVSNLRASFRYMAAGSIILGTLFFSLIYFVMVYKAPGSKALEPISEVLGLFIQMSGSVFSFMFGDRVYLHLRKR